MSKAVGLNFYGFEGKSEAEHLAGKIMDNHESIVQYSGGYPGAVYVLDLEDTTWLDEAPVFEDEVTEMEDPEERAEMWQEGEHD